MGRARKVFIRCVFATFAGGCSVIAALAVFNWAMTERFGLNASWRESLLISASALIGCAVGSLVLLALLSAVSRFRPLPRWLAAGMGGLLYWLTPSALLLHLGPGLLALPAGVIAGLILSGAQSEGRPYRPAGKLAFASGILLWLGLLAMPARDAWSENQLSRQPAPKSLLGERVMGGAVAGSELWLFNQGGKAVSFRLADWHPTLRSTSGVAALATTGDDMVALIAPAFDWRADHQPAGRFRLSSYRGSGWAHSGWQPYAVDERPFALVLRSKGAIILGRKKLYLGQSTGDQLAVLPLSQAIEPWGQFVTALASDDVMYRGGSANLDRLLSGVFCLKAASMAAEQEMR